MHNLVAHQLCAAQPPFQNRGRQAAPILNTSSKKHAREIKDFTQQANSPGTDVLPHVQQRKETAFGETKKHLDADVLAQLAFPIEE